jgi:hypothetical protein
VSVEPSVAELRALAEHATQRLALQRRRVYVGRGDPSELAELERIAQGAADRLRRAERARGALADLDDSVADGKDQRL